VINVILGINVRLGGKSDWEESQTGVRKVRPDVKFRLVREKSDWGEEYTEG
jgi:hypothetical protein